ncbi:MAG: amidohydrolase family protein [Dehalococcoidia bacterium]
MALLIRDALVLRTDQAGDRRELPTNILIEDGEIARLGDASGWTAEEEAHADGRLVMPGFVDAHIHPDKAFLGERITAPRTGSIEEGLQITIDFKRKYEATEVCERASRVMREASRNGTTAMRAFADVGTAGGLVPLEGLLLAREAMSALVDVQLVALPQEGLLRDPGAAELLEEALKMGADVVGGMPGYEYTDNDTRKHIDVCFELADRYERPIHMIVDPFGDPTSRGLEYLAAKALHRGGGGRVCASWDTLALYNDVYAAKVIELLKMADITIVSSPHISLALAGRGSPQPQPRGITRVRELLEAGVNIACGQDDVNDPFYPFGKPDLLEVALFMSHMAHMTLPPDDLHAVIDMVTVNGAKALGLADYGLDVGCRADLVIADASSIQEALRTRADRYAVVKAGRIVAQSRGRTELVAG